MRYRQPLHLEVLYISMSVQIFKVILIPLSWHQQRMKISDVVHY